MKYPLTTLLLMAWISLLSHSAAAQSLKPLQAAVNQLQQSADMRSASWGVAVVDVSSGKLLLKQDGHRALSTASTMKAITTATALAVLGPDFRFETQLAIDGKLENGTLRGNLYIRGDGDPTLGSDRMGEEYELNRVLNTWVEAVKAAGIERIEGAVIADATIFTSQLTPSEWPWEDMGNYYGAGASGLNIQENMYRLDFRSGRTGTLTEVLRTEPAMEDLTFVNEVLAGPPGSGDNAYIFGAPFTYVRYLRGTIPPNRGFFSIKGSMADPALTTARWLHQELNQCGVEVVGTYTSLRTLWAEDDIPYTTPREIHSFHSAPLRDIVGETNRESINLYAEALAKRVAVALGREGSTEAAIDAIEDYWRRQGVDVQGMSLRDGSGLSPNNAVSARQLAFILAKTRQSNIGEEFDRSLPVAGRSGTLSKMLKGTAAEGNLRAKSGYISGVRSYAGYVDLPDGRTVAFAMLINHCSCGASSMRRKLEQLMAALAQGG